MRNFSNLLVTIEKQKLRAKSKKKVTKKKVNPDKD